MKVFIWGIGKITALYLDEKELNSDMILCFIESKKSQDYYRGKRVYEPNEIAIRDDYDYILVCVYYYGRAIYDICKKIGINTDKLVLVDNWEWIDGSVSKEPLRNICKKINGNNINIKKVFPKLYKMFSSELDTQAKRYIVVSRNGYDLCDDKALMLNEEFLGKEYQVDYFRYRTFELIANEILRKKIAGNVAEVGVYKGVFSKIINAKFLDRKLFLFDTFESFDEKEFQYEQKLGRCPEYFYQYFSNTSEEKVISEMPYPEQCIIKKGLFPNTSEGLEKEKYAFVSIDVDFEKSILEGLRYFYPRLTVGGAIFVHDYNNRFLEGVKRAIDAYEEELGYILCKVPLADEGGTLVLTK